MEKKAMYLTIATLLLLSIVLVGAVSAAPAAPKPKPLATPKLLSPANNSVENLFIDFHWKPVKNADFYWLELISCDASFLNCRPLPNTPFYSEQPFIHDLDWIGQSWEGETNGPTGIWVVYALTIDPNSISASAPRYFSVM